MSSATTLIGLSAAQEALQDALEAMTFNGRALKTYPYDPGMPDEVPCVVMSMPDLAFPEIDQPQRQMGTVDVEFIWPVTIYVSAQVLKYAHESMLILMGGLVDAIEADQTLGQTCEDVRVVSMQPTFIFNVAGGQPKLICECHIHGYLFVTA